MLLGALLPEDPKLFRGENCAPLFLGFAERARCGHGHNPTTKTKLGMESEEGGGRNEKSGGSNTLCGGNGGER